MRQIELIRLIRKGLNKDRHVQTGHFHGFRDRTLIAKVGQADQNPINLIAPAAEQIGAGLGLLKV